MFLEAHSIPKITKHLLIINIGLYIFTVITGLFNKTVIFFGLIPSAILEQFQVWRLVTYLFIHRGAWHLLLNMFALWMFGPEIERHMNSKKFLFYYLLTGVAGGLAALAFGHLAIGASASIFGLLVAFGIMFPDAVISLIFPPVAMRAKQFVIIFGIFQFIMMVGPDSGVAWEAHLGGMLSGYIYFRYNTIGNKIKLRLGNVKSRYISTRKRRRNQFIEEEVNPILDKINKTGINNLTKKERYILKKARYRI